MCAEIDKSALIPAFPSQTHALEKVVLAHQSLLSLHLNQTCSRRPRPHGDRRLLLRQVRLRGELYSNRCPELQRHSHRSPGDCNPPTITTTTSSSPLHPYHHLPTILILIHTLVQAEEQVCAMRCWRRPDMCSVERGSMDITPSKPLH
ncbi:hypothetical protein QQF64_002879 [Cirrhinus molitorella]|uniref:Uncharacterized protein n=1 Tax=Cirrhinus molitorella TaxID=172907 RepID=A0ABR3MRF9_9TELE